MFPSRVIGFSHLLSKSRKPPATKGYPFLTESDKRMLREPTYENKPTTFSDVGCISGLGFTLLGSTQYAFENAAKEELAYQPFYFAFLFVGHCVFSGLPWTATLSAGGAVLDLIINSDKVFEKSDQTSEAEKAKEPKPRGISKHR